MPVTIAVISGKGGVGKTTVTATLAAALGARGARVLAVDVDGQGNLSQALGVARSRIRWSVADVLVDDLELGDILLRTVAPGVVVAPSAAAMFDAGEELRHRVQRHGLLRARLRSVSDGFDAVFIDSPPALGFHTTSALVAADFALIPTQVSGFALSGLSDSLELIGHLARGENPQLRLLGLLPTFLDTDVEAHREVLRALHRLDVPQFETVIPYDPAFAEASLLGVPVTSHAPDSAGARAFDAAAGELLSRLAAAGSALPNGAATTVPMYSLVPADDLATELQTGPRSQGLLRFLFRRRRREPALEVRTPS